MMMRELLTTVVLATALLTASQGSAEVASPQILAQHEQGHAMAADHDVRSFTVGDLVIENPWARESVTKTGAVYLTVHNAGAQDDRLVGATSDVAERTEVHSSVMQDGVMKMQPVEAVDVPAAGEAALAPGGLHVMLMGLKTPLEEGKTFPLVLEFERAGKVEVTVAVEDIGHTGTESHSH
jgi:hypothetical protein